MLAIELLTVAEEFVESWRREFDDVYAKANLPFNMEFLNEVKEILNYAVSVGATTKLGMELYKRIKKHVLEKKAKQLPGPRVFRNRG